MSDTLTDFTAALLDLVPPPSTRADVVPMYAMAILLEVYARPLQAKTCWEVVNRAIIDRWSVSGLGYIKQRAWKQAETRAREPR